MFMCLKQQKVLGLFLFHLTRAHLSFNRAGDGECARVNVCECKVVLFEEENKSD